MRDALKDTDTMGWTAGRQSVANTGTQVANFLATADIGYHADFVAFDQWGRTSATCGTRTRPGTSAI